MIDSIYSTLYNIDIPMLVVLGICVLFSLLFLLVGIALFKRRFFPSFFFLLSLLSLFSAPFFIAYGSKKFLFKTTILHNQSRPLMFSDSFLIHLSFRNDGYRKIKHCMITISPKREKNLRNQLLDIFKPLERSYYVFSADISPHAAKQIQTIIPYFMREHAFKLILDCR
ncbi:DUF2393 domain-containing protein [Helicobacter mustelae]|uniref:Putative periplasmic protein n=1 Tax=Helicobacter mustelae (strain ATCC 43772 / CCUG 25715 / CIP 103759 / LMG 18044 / NCTC 12198 / R85-136P) TaxID=679897 RepID=D3UJ86_HELM1|nr:DUF2393 domain-containing protein [Helicobacter mustelae]CBG40561.1 Putative periplasmic protein [Helicobacter mustelae 12198]SQH72058.1 periplasmic protein [Helicobacter mustelae]STP13201.1 periplasmic protein [Helicobacter mustelae]